jgi:hypothetical protein
VQKKWLRNEATETENEIIERGIIALSRAMSPVNWKGILSEGEEWRSLCLCSNWNLRMWYWNCYGRVGNEARLCML